MKVSIAAVVTSLVFAARAAGQAPSPASCVQKLNAPSEDSLVLEIAIRVVPPDTARSLPTSLTDLIGQGIRQEIVLPRPLPLDVYEQGNGQSSQTLKGVYRMLLRRDGHLTDARTVGGTRSTPFDDAVVRAIVALDTLGLIPPLDAPAMANVDTMTLGVVIEPVARWGSTIPKAASAPEPGRTPLMRLRVPHRRSSGGPAPKPGNRAPLYPRAARDASVAGQVVIEFVVDADGVADMTTLQAVRATAMPFVSAVVDVLPSHRFEPLTIDGCPVAALVRMPFSFNVSP